MMKSKDFNNLLDECLEQVLAGGETVEQCLAEHPDDAAALEPLLRTALAASEAARIEPRPEFRERARYQFQAAIREMEMKKSPGLFGWQPRWAMALVVVIVLLLAGGGTVAAAGDSLPDETLYPVKLATETVRLALHTSALGKEELYVELADRRVAEIVAMADKGEVEQVQRTAARLNQQLIAMASLDLPGGEATAGEEVMTLQAPAAGTVEEPSAAVAPEMAPAETTVPAPTPAPAPAPATEEAAPRQARTGQPEAANKALTAPEVEAPPVVAPEEETQVMAAPRAWGPSADTDTSSDRRTRLRWALATQAIENQETLREVLEKVPESARPALEEAIEMIGNGYEEALRNLE